MYHPSLTKGKILQDSIIYSKVKASSRKTRISQIEGKLKACEEKAAEVPSPENLENLEPCKTAYEREYDYMVRGSIIRSRARWYEQGKRNTKYFLNLETHNKKKSCVRRLLNSDGAEITDANNTGRKNGFTRVAKLKIIYCKCHICSGLFTFATCRCVKFAMILQT